MAAPRLTGALLLLIPWLGAAGCAAPRPPVARAAEPKQPAPASTPSPAVDSTPAAPAPAPAVPEATPQSRVGIVDVVDPGGDAGNVSLVQAAKAERERRSHSGEPIAVITDKSLPHMAKGQLTFADKKKGVEKPAAAPVDARDEQYWRGRALDIRTRWREAADEVKDLEKSAAGWRRRFYAENDPYQRDGQIKPEWDRVLDRMGKAREEAEAAKKELEEFMDEGRRAGALPGWLREGSENEPVEEKKKDREPGTVEPKEPPIYQQDDGHGL